VSAAADAPFERRIVLPHTDLAVGRIGLGSSFGVGPDAIELAFDHGIDYLYWGSIRRPGFAEGIRRLARRGRERIAVAVQSYARWPAAALHVSVEVALRRLRLDYADVLVLGWWNARPPQALLDAALSLRERGRVRHLLLSGHDRRFFPVMAREGLFDLFMVRYNAAHRGAEREVLPELPDGARRPGIVAYTATRWGTLLDPKRLPPGEPVPRASHCYRFCLSHPGVDLVLSGPANEEQVREAVLALEKGPLDPDELAWMRRVGDHVYRRSPVRRLAD
jgi:aryl-alcohol dehydrogenase-like predicted oxidoreductase